MCVCVTSGIVESAAEAPPCFLFDFLAHKARKRRHYIRVFWVGGKRYVWQWLVSCPINNGNDSIRGISRDVIQRSAKRKWQGHWKWQHASLTVTYKEKSAPLLSDWLKVLYYRRRDLQSVMSHRQINLQEQIIARSVWAIHCLVESENISHDSFTNFPGSCNACGN